MKLSKDQIEAMKLMKNKPAGFHEFCRLGIYGSTIGSLVRKGLAHRIVDGRFWLTELGHAELDARVGE